METIKPIDPLLEAALDPRAFEPKTWYASCFGVNDNAQTVLIGPYDEDELIQEAERRGAVRALRGVRARIDVMLTDLRAHEYEEREEPESFGFTEEDWR